MKTLPTDYTFCTNHQCPLKNCLRKRYPKAEKLSFTHFEPKWDESLKKYVCDMQITGCDYFGDKK